MVDVGKKRGRPAGQVPPKTQLTLLVLDADIASAEQLANELSLPRATILSRAITEGLVVLEREGLRRRPAAEPKASGRRRGKEQ